MIRILHVVVAKCGMSKVTVRNKTALLQQDDSGSSIVEFAICCGFFYMCVCAVMYLCLLIYANHYVSSAANDAARYAAVRGASWSGTACTSITSSNCTATTSNISNYVQATLPAGLTASALSVSTTWPGTTPTGTVCDTANGTNGPDCIVEVQVTYQFSFPMPFIPQAAVPLSATSALSILE